MSQSNNGAFQTFSTLLALLLPVLQVFFSFLPDGSNSIFLISEYLLVISIIAGILSYVLIIAFKNTAFFEFTFARKRKKEYKEFLVKTDVRSNDEADIKKAYKKPVERPFYITPHNVYFLLIPALVLLLLLFLSLGIIFEGTNNQWIILIQAVVYILSVAITTLTLAVFYINESNRVKYDSKESNKYKRVIELLIENDSLPGAPNIRFVAQKSETYDSLQTYILVNEKDIFEVTTDNNISSLRQVLPYNAAPSPPNKPTPSDENQTSHTEEVHNND